MEKDNIKLTSEEETELKGHMKDFMMFDSYTQASPVNKKSMLRRARCDCIEKILERRKNKGFSRLFLLLIIGAVVLIGMGVVFGLSEYQKSQNREKQSQTLIQEQQKVLEDTKNELEALKNKGQDTSIIPPKNQATAPKPQQTPSIQKNTSQSVYSEWQWRVVKIACVWYTSQSSGLPPTVFGSGTFIGTNIVTTNRHVVYGDYDGVSNRVADKCIVSFIQDQSNLYEIYPANMKISNSYDFATIQLDSNPDQYYTGLSQTRVNFCKNGAAIGDQVLILGYPSIGASNSDVGLTVTATDGIISGTDGTYYVTSAKIDHGNSGGLAVLVQNDCYLGIPSAAVTGEIESLGRILDFRNVGIF